MKKLGRITLWLVFWPAGLWRSMRHGQRKRDERLVRALGGDTGELEQRRSSIFASPVSLLRHRR